LAKKSKQIDNRIKSSEHVSGAASTHKEQIAERLAERALEIQGPQTKANKAFFLDAIDFFTDTLDHSVKTLDGTELTVVAERADDVPVRNSRDTANVEMVNACVRMKSMVNDALGPASLPVYGLSGETPRTPREVAAHARTVASLMKEKPFLLTVDGVSFNSTAMAATLEAKATTLENALTDMTREEQELSDALGLRDKQVEVWTDDYQGVADVIVGLFRLAGRKDLSERVRPTNRVLSGDDIAEPVPPAEDQTSTTPTTTPSTTPTTTPTGGGSGSG